MTKQELVRSEMVKAMKIHDKARKDALSLLLAALKNAEIDRRCALSEAEENEVVQKEIKQVKETMSLCPAERIDIKQQCEFRIKVFEEFCPDMMLEVDILVCIDEVLKELGISNPTNKDKGRIMKVLMPRVKGKADGKVVNQLVMDILK